MAKIAYYDVAQQCNQLMLLGEKPSVRKLRAVLGGSFTTINEHLRQWRNEQEIMKDSDFEISKELQDVLQSEFIRVAKEVRNITQETLEEKTSDLEDALKEINELAGKNTQLETKISEAMKQHEEYKTEIEKKLAILESELNYLKDEKQSLHKKLGEVTREKHNAEILTAEANARLDEIRKQIGNKKNLL